MLGILYLVLAAFIGFNIIKALLPLLFKVKGFKCLSGDAAGLPCGMVVLPAAFLTGTLVVTWVTYLFSYAFYWAGKPLLYGNIASFTLFAVISLFIAFKKKEGLRRLFVILRGLDLQKIRVFLEEYRLEVFFSVLALAISAFLMFYTFNIRSNTMYIGLSVWSDFGPHLAVIRSFSEGSNFPTEYPHFAAAGIRYHFMFQFLAGNLEYLGLRIDWAFNIPSILSMMAFFMMLYSFAVILTGKRWIGIIANILFFFRSSFAFFTYISGMKSLGEAVAKIFGNDTYIGKTTNENWGLWNQNVYINQRHLAFALAVLLLILLVMYPLFKRMLDSLKEVNDRIYVPVSGSRSVIFKEKCRELFFMLDCWAPVDIKRSVVMGLMLGMLSFWNGAVVFSALPILFFMAVFSKHRLEYLNIAVITVVLSLVESAFFMGTDTAAVNPRIFIGFLANNKDFAGILRYYVELLGILPFVLIAALFIAPRGMRWLMLAFFTPLIMATTIQLTPDINANHKFVIISVILLNIPAAYLLYRMLKSKRVIVNITVIMLVITMTITGVVDFITLCNLNISRRCVTAQTDDPVMLWVEENTGPNEVFLTDVHVIHPILLAGRKIFYGWPYYAWSAGYDTMGREAVVNQIYGGTDIERIKELVTVNNISYIVIEEGNRNSKAYALNEKLIKSSFKAVYVNEGRDIAIYRTY